LLQLPTPRYLHVPVVTNTAGEKLSKQTGASALDLDRPLEALMAAAMRLGLVLPATAGTDLTAFWEAAISDWTRRFV